MNKDYPIIDLSHLFNYGYLAQEKILSGKEVRLIEAAPEMVQMLKELHTEGTARATLEIREGEAFPE